MILLKQSTAATIRCGPFVDVTNGVTPETGVTLSGADQAEILKASGATVDISGATFAAITGCAGWYDLSATTSHTDTLGMLTVVIQDESVCLPVFVRAMVVPPMVWDSLVGGTDTLQADVTQINGTASSFGLVRRNTAQAGAAGTITLDASASATNDFYNGAVVYVASGTGAGQAPRIISDYVGSTKVASVDPNWITTPDNTSVFEVWAAAPSPTTAVPAVNTTQFAGQTVTAAAGVTLPSSVASPTNITAGTITTVTNLTNAPTSGDFTATMKTSIGTAVAASAVASVTGNVGGNVTGSVGSVAANGITASSIATDAIGSAELAASAVTKITDAITAAAAADPLAVNIKEINDTAITGDGTSGTEWGPA